MILDKILLFKKGEITRNKEYFPLASFKSGLKKSDRDFKEAIKKNDLSIIAEIKRKSPSEGLINSSFNFKSIASSYDKNIHVKALSILTDYEFFQGTPDYLREARKLTSKPLLRKDFIIDEYQIYESRFYGADAILLIARILSKNQMHIFIETAKKYNMACLVEVHNEADIKKLPVNTEIIGINNRDLDTLEINLNNTLKLALPIKKKFKDAIIVSESGINDFKDIKKIDGCVSAVLIGTSLLKSENIGEKINSFFPPKIKICGITNLEDAKNAVSFGADYLGFIFYSDSPRYISCENAAHIISSIKKMNIHVKFVGVFVNEGIERIKEIKKKCSLDFIQLHGDEDLKFVKNLNESVIKVFRVKDSADVYKINNSSYEYILLDNFDKDLYGGTGNVFDWDILSGIKEKKIFLSGGINADNIKKALKSNIYSIDVSSGVEISPGKKDIDKLRKLFESIR
jgi:indole-3-glycerol phosphate synthase/phosphoribosylanthranilate isomerase